MAVLQFANLHLAVKKGGQRDNFMGLNGSLQITVSKLRHFAALKPFLNAGLVAIDYYVLSTADSIPSRHGSRQLLPRVNFKYH